MKDNVGAFLHGLHDRPQDMQDVPLVLPAITNNNCGGDQPKHGKITTQWCFKARSESKINTRDPSHPQIPGILGQTKVGIVMQHHRIIGLEMFRYAQIKKVSPDKNLNSSIPKVL
jgi:hypothetical protein